MTEDEKTAVRALAYAYADFHEARISRDAASIAETGFALRDQQKIAGVYIVLPSVLENAIRVARVGRA